MQSLAIFLVMMLSSVSYARIAVRVGAYEFPPYFELINGKQVGLTVDTVRILNNIQKDYAFEVQRLPAKQRYAHLARKRIDLFLFEDPAWEWSKTKYEFIPLDVEDGEVYVTKKGGAPSPTKFEDLKQLRIAVVQGFHYGFAGLDADERSLKRNFKIELAEDSKGSLNLVLGGFADVTVVAKSYIYDYIRKNADTRDKIEISNNYDSIYKLGVVFNPAGRIPREKLESIVGILKKNQQFMALIDSRFKVQEKVK